MLDANENPYHTVATMEMAFRWMAMAWLRPKFRLARCIFAGSVGAGLSSLLACSTPGQSGFDRNRSLFPSITDEQNSCRCRTKKRGKGGKVTRKDIVAHPACFSARPRPSWSSARRRTSSEPLSRPQWPAVLYPNLATECSAVAGLPR